jgi:hypothetical protein
LIRCRRRRRSDQLTTTPPCTRGCTSRSGSTPDRPHPTAAPCPVPERLRQLRDQPGYRPALPSGDSIASARAVRQAHLSARLPRPQRSDRPAPSVTGADRIASRDERSAPNGRALGVCLLSAGAPAIRTAEDWVVGGDAARVFARIGAETLPEVIKALEEVLKTEASERPKVVLWALRGFGESGGASGAGRHARAHAPKRERAPCRGRDPPERSARRRSPPSRHSVER